MVTIEKGRTHVTVPATPATVLAILRSAKAPTAKAVQSLASWYGASALQRAKAHERLPDAAEALDSEAKWLHQYAHARGFCEGVDLAIKILAGEEATRIFQDAYLKPEWRSAAGLPPKEEEE